MNTVRFRDCSLFRLAVFVILPIIIVVWTCNKGNYYSAMVSTFAINVLLAASLNLVNGFSGMFSMGHAAFMAVGAYISAFLTMSPSQKASILPGLPQWLINVQLPLLVALIFCGLAAAFVALLIGIPVLRFKGHYLSVATLGLIVIVRAVLDNSDSITNGPRGITGLPNVATAPLIFFVLMLSLFIMFRLIRSQYGRGLIAMRDDSVAAQSLGINLTVKKISIFCISAFFAGVGGALWGHVQTVISGQFFYYSMSFKIVQISIIGGMASLSGAAIGALFMTFVPELLAPLESGFTIFGVTLPSLYGLSNIIMAVFLILVIIFRRQGLLGSSEILLESWFSKETYTGLFKKSEYQKLLAAFKRRPSRWKK
jgi:branched-chain amino acid transport system permease protein